MSGVACLYKWIDVPKSKKKSGVEKVRDKRKKDFVADAAKCSKLTYLFKFSMPLPNKILLALVCLAEVITSTVHHSVSPIIAQQEPLPGQRKNYFNAKNNAKYPFIMKSIAFGNLYSAVPKHESTSLLLPGKLLVA